MKVISRVFGTAKLILVTILTVVRKRIVIALKHSEAIIACMVFSGCHVGKFIANKSFFPYFLNYFYFAFTVSKRAKKIVSPPKKRLAIIAVVYK